MNNRTADLRPRGIRGLISIVSAIAAILAVYGSPPTASAEPPEPAAGRKLVVLGDSYTANGVRLDGNEMECRHGPTAWPIQLSRLLNVAGTPDFVDVSCPGASIRSYTAYNLVHEARIADGMGAFGPRTEIIAIQLGMNDTWGANNTMMWTAMGPCIFNLRDGCDLEAAEQGRIPDFRAVTGQEYANRVRAVIEYLRYYAPNARIVFVGYPELFPPGSNVLCASALGAVPIIQQRGRAVVEYLDRLDRAQREAAEILGVHFFDARAVTAGHGLCSAEPWINGFFDPRADFIGMPFHPTARGDTALAVGLRDWIGH
ncbi:SGNH/GDSL hydrolase family protein [Nocardia paucivorans]|uniref:SGNH/GDSL hydrolase family protein n=1 Tax=Nocardia paucivorans TaxID=114259 RepID=UPI0002F5BF97|nr:SGNH/GDSL hydrolase family protein [Nocardia paucivorans]